VTWTKLSYYFPQQEFCLLMDYLHAGNFEAHASLWRDKKCLRRYDGNPVPIPLAGAKRIIWIVGEDTPIRNALGNRLHVAGPGGIYWTPAEPIEVLGYRFVEREPTPLSSQQAGSP
jgi:hypothetical protein